MIKLTWWQVVTRSEGKSRARSVRHAHALGLRPEILEDRTLLAGSPLPGSLDPSFNQGGIAHHRGERCRCRMHRRVAARRQDRARRTGRNVHRPGDHCPGSLPFLNGQLDTTFWP